MTTITLPRAVVEQALEALEYENSWHKPRNEKPYASTLDAIEALRAALAQEQAEPVAWMRVLDEAMVAHHLGVAEPSDDYEAAKRKMNSLLCVAQDIGTYFAKEAEPVQEPDSPERRCGGPGCDMTCCQPTPCPDCLGIGYDASGQLCACQENPSF